MHLLPKNNSATTLTIKLDVNFENVKNNKWPTLRRQNLINYLTLKNRRLKYGLVPHNKTNPSLYTKNDTHFLPRKP